MMTSPNRFLRRAIGICIVAAFYLLLDSGTIGGTQAGRFKDIIIGVIFGITIVVNIREYMQAKAAETKAV